MIPALSLGQEMGGPSVDFDDQAQLWVGEVEPIAPIGPPADLGLGQPTR